MNNQQLLTNINTAQMTGELSFEQWYVMKTAIEALGETGVQNYAEEARDELIEKLRQASESRIAELEGALRKGLLMLSYQDGPAERPEHQVKNIQAQFREQAKKALLGEDYTKAELDCKGCMGPCGNCEPEAVQHLRACRLAQKSFYKAKQGTQERIDAYRDSVRAEQAADEFLKRLDNAEPKPVDLFSVQ